MRKLKNEYKSFLDDVEKNIKNEEDLTYVKERFATFLDVVLEEVDDFEIVCPYCNYEFVIDVDENKTEVECPECQNVIELDWTGDIDGEDNDLGECMGNCHGCHGCEEEENEDDM